MRQLSDWAFWKRVPTLSYCLVSAIIESTALCSKVCRKTGISNTVMRFLPPAKTSQSKSGSWLFILMKTLAKFKWEMRLRGRRINGNLYQKKDITSGWSDSFRGKTVDFWTHQPNKHTHPDPHRAAPSEATPPRFNRTGCHGNSANNRSREKHSQWTSLSHSKAEAS